MIALHLRADEQTLNDRADRVGLVLVRSGGWRFPSPRVVEQARFDAWRRGRAIDRLRRESRGQELLSGMALLLPGNDDTGIPEEPFLGTKRCNGLKGF